MRLITLLIAFCLVSCQVAHVGPKWPVTPNVAAESTYKITVEFSAIPGVPVAMSSGTAWTVAVKDGWSYVMTAGHVCALEVPGAPIKKFQLIASNDDAYDVTLAALDHDPEDVSKDLCLLKIEGYLSDPLMISRTDPRYNDPLAYVGAPAGAWGNGMAPTFVGVECGGQHFCGPTTQGASGSAIFTRDGVIGVLVRVNMQFKFIVSYIPRETILDFLKKHKI